ncbi:MAG: cyclic nucleotide-binding domain-containing protein, partial [Alphaproteobacteria bacterium]|nr:cyclic nucleotide-binding domain-containing protein [Alphaproteobacteria bacterium]
MNDVGPHDEESSRLRLRQALHRAPLFADLDTPTMFAIEQQLTSQLLPGGTPLFHKGDVSDAIYVVASGCLGVFRHEDETDPDGPALIAEITPGNIVGEMSLLSQSPRTRDVAALRDSEVWRLGRESFEALTARHPEALPALMRNVAVRNAMGPAKRRRQPRTFALLPTGPDVAQARFSVLLSAALERISDHVQVLGGESLGQEP